MALSATGYLAYYVRRSVAGATVYWIAKKLSARPCSGTTSRGAGAASQTPVNNSGRLNLRDRGLELGHIDLP